METITAQSKKQAVRKILALLGHDNTGSIQAQLDAAQIDEDENDNRCAFVYTHPSIAVEVIVNY